MLFKELHGKCQIINLYAEQGFEVKKTGGDKLMLVVTGGEF
jgi:hypothetical protein